eukprot:4580134-Amphidinium_carterae.1
MSQRRYFKVIFSFRFEEVSSQGLANLSPIWWESRSLLHLRRFGNPDFHVFCALPKHWRGKYSNLFTPLVVRSFDTLS